jgi:hypothetical protein
MLEPYTWKSAGNPSRKTLRTAHIAAICVTQTLRKYDPLCLDRGWALTVSDSHNMGRLFDLQLSRLCTSPSIFFVAIRPFIGVNRFCACVLGWRKRGTSARCRRVEVELWFGPGSYVKENSIDLSGPANLPTRQNSPSLLQSQHACRLAGELFLCHTMHPCRVRGQTHFCLVHFRRRHFSSFDHVHPSVFLTHRHHVGVGSDALVLAC